METTPEIRFCVKYLLAHGINSSNFDSVVQEFRKNDQNFELVKTKNYDFFYELAVALRDLWPAGEKAGKYPWRDSIANLTKKLKVLWKERLNDKDYTLEECLTAARRYLSHFEQDTKYMRILKYFILKKKHDILEDGSVVITYESIFADMLEGKRDEDAILNEWEGVMNSSDFGEGELI